ncbi:glucosyltransferase domain-containing protein [Candidatus Saccharibacteria bacterium]|nr:glucosyltransferase domain-containing protein [Candidatus Saccharibacteria bacterium]
MKGKLWERNRFLLKPILVMFVIYLVGISAIILAGVHYADDVARTNYGYAGWSAFSRYSSTFLSHGIHADNYLTNIAPLPQILAALILAVASVILICLVSGKEIFRLTWIRWFLRLVAVAPLALCPYMLECLSYQYDAVYMALSVFFAVMPFVFYRQARWKFILASIVGILGVCTTYQVSIGIYLMLVVFLAIKDWNGRKFKNKEIIKSLLISAVVFLLTLLFFQKVLMRTRDVYVSNELPGLTEFFPSLSTHLLHYFELLFKDFRLLWLVLIGIMTLGFVAMFVKRSRQNKILACVVGIVGVAAMGVASYLLYAALDKPLYTTRAMYAVGAFIAILGVYIVSGEEYKKLAVKVKEKKNEFSLSVCLNVEEIVFTLATVVLSWCFFSFSFTYGNALKEQDTFRNMQIDMVISDLNEMLDDGRVRKIQAVGQIDFAPAIKHMPENEYYILKRLLKPSFGTDVPWMAYRLTEASGLFGLIYDPNIDLVNKDLPVLKDTALYIIYGDLDNILVKFKGEEFDIWEN